MPRPIRSAGAIVLLVLLAVVSTACAAQRRGGGNDASTLTAGDHEFSLRHGRRSRYYLVHVPPGTARRPLPLVIAMHGGGGNPGQFKSEAGIDRVADREGFIVVYPAGTGVTRRTLLTWNAGTDCCGYALERRVDDVGFLKAVIDDVAARIPVDPRRVYATGHSNGAMMAYRFGVEATDRLAAIAPVAGAMMVARFAPSRPLPVLHIHSVDDSRALYDGGLGPPSPGGDRRVTHAPVMTGLTRWAAHNGCAATAHTLTERTGDPGSADAGHRAVKLSWEPCTSGAPVIHWQLHGVGHGWPGTPTPRAREALVGSSTTLISAAEEAWIFFRNFSGRPSDAGR